MHARPRALSLSIEMASPLHSFLVTGGLLFRLFIVLFDFVPACVCDLYAKNSPDGFLLCGRRKGLASLIVVQELGTVYLGWHCVLQDNTI